MPARTDLPTKTCAVCGRVITWRRKWARDWDNVRYCSDACRRRARNAAASQRDADLERAVLTLLQSRHRDATICPSEAARVVDPENWRTLMEPARAAARRLVDQGLVQITQHGRPVDPSTARGPVRVRLVPLG